jgi:hypothetical protein
MIIDAQILAYVKASAVLQGLSLDEVRANAVAVHLSRTARLAQLLDGAPLAAEDELAEIYRPLAFQVLSNKHKQL